MDWEQKLEAIKALGSGTCLRMRKPGDWYVGDTRVDVGGDGCLAGKYGNGTTPSEAVENHWEKWTNLAAGFYLVTRGNTEEEKHFRWNGYMWEDI